MTDIDTMRRALQADPDDEMCYSLLADALAEAGRQVEADRYRRGKPCLSDVLPRFIAYFEKNPTWGCLALTLDWGNYTDEDVQGSMEWAAEQGDTEGQILARVLMRMSNTQRRKIDPCVREATDG